MGARIVPHGGARVRVRDPERRLPDDRDGRRARDELAAVEVAAERVARRDARLAAERGGRRDAPPLGLAAQREPRRRGLRGRGGADGGPPLNGYAYAHAQRFEELRHLDDGCALSGEEYVGEACTMWCDNQGRMAEDLAAEGSNGRRLRGEAGQSRAAETIEYDREWGGCIVSLRTGWQLVPADILRIVRFQPKPWLSGRCANGTSEYVWLMVATRTSQGWPLQ